MRILIIEDETKTANYLRKGLNESGFQAEIASNGEDGLHQATQVHYDLIILDIMLPKLDGWTIIKMLRQSTLAVPVLFLTARDSLEDKVKGLELGADDYLIKPFAFSELLARVKGLLRRGNVARPEHIIVDDLVIDLIKHKATRNSSRLELTAKEFDLLVLLAQHQGEVLTRTFIAERVWDIHFDSNTNVIDVAIKRLRKKVDDAYDAKLIHTVRGRGYVLEKR